MLVGKNVYFIAGLGDPSQRILPTDPFGETEVEEIVALGFTREQVNYVVYTFYVYN